MAGHGPSHICTPGSHCSPKGLGRAQGSWHSAGRGGPEACWSSQLVERRAQLRCCSRVRPSPQQGSPRAETCLTAQPTGAERQQEESLWTRGPWGGRRGARGRGCRAWLCPRPHDTHGFRLKRSLNPGVLASLLLCFSAISFSFVQVICTLSGTDRAWGLVAAAAWDAVFLSWISWAWRTCRGQHSQRLTRATQWTAADEPGWPWKRTSEQWPGTPGHPGPGIAVPRLSALLTPPVSEPPPPPALPPCPGPQNHMEPWPTTEGQPGAGAGPSRDR